MMDEGLKDDQPTMPLIKSFETHGKCTVAINLTVFIPTIGQIFDSLQASLAMEAMP